MIISNYIVHIANFLIINTNMNMIMNININMNLFISIILIIGIIFTANFLIVITDIIAISAFKSHLF